MGCDFGMFFDQFWDQQMIKNQCIFDVHFLILGGFLEDFGLILGGFWEPRAVILGIDFLMIFRYRPKSGPRAPKRRFGVVFGWSGGGLGA